MSASLTLPRGAAVCHLPARLQLACGAVLPSPVLAYERQGPSDAETVVVLGGISAGRHVSAHTADPRPGFWDDLVGPGRAIDTAAFSVLAIDWLGGAGASTGPRGEAAFPAVSTADQADAIALLLDRLGIGRLRAFVGSSYGGMVGLAFAARHAGRLRRLGAIAAAERSHPLASAWRHIQRGIVEFGLRRGGAGEALALARQLAMTTYRSPAEFAARFGDFELLRQWLGHHGATFAQRFPPQAFLCLCASIDDHRIEPELVRAPTWLCGFDSDQLVPADQVAALAERLPDCRRHVTVPTPYGHDAFLKEPAGLQPLLAEVLS